MARVRERRSPLRADEWLGSLGKVPLRRILMTPPPGTATEEDARRSHEEKGILCDLVEGTLIERQSEGEE